MKANKLAKFTAGIVVKLQTREYGEFSHPEILVLPPNNWGDTISVVFQRNAVSLNEGATFHSSIVEARALFDKVAWVDVGRVPYGPSYAPHIDRLYPEAIDRAAAIWRVVKAWPGTAYGDEVVRWVEAVRDSGVPVEIRYDGEVRDRYELDDDLRGKSREFWYSPEVSLRLADFIRKDAEERIRYAKAA